MDKQNEVKSGFVKRVIFTRNYGFITDENGDDVFFHRLGVIKPEFEELREGLPVEFFEVTDKRGLRAIGVVGK